VIGEGETAADMAGEGMESGAGAVTFTVNGAGASPAAKATSAVGTGVPAAATGSVASAVLVVAWGDGAAPAAAIAVATAVAFPTTAPEFLLDPARLPARDRLSAEISSPFASTSGNPSMTRSLCAMSSSGIVRCTISAMDSSAVHHAAIDNFAPTFVSSMMRHRTPIRARSSLS
jgi:hypothetical protein